VIRRLLLTAAMVLALAAPAAAGPSQESTFQDDNLLVYPASREALRSTLDRLRSLGVDRLRVTVLWKIVAPDPASRTRPRFDATDPAAYPPGAWDRFDAIVEEARARGMDVNFNVTGPAPLWATREAPRQDIVETFEPDPREFAQFVAAAGRRYPSVGYWSVWNEPNHSGWLTPQWSQDGGGFERAATLYRELAGAAWSALNATGHGAGTFLVGETAPKGDRSKGVKRYMEAMTFLRALYCVDGRYRPLTGARAAELSCGATPAAFRDAHPALFSATGYAHHPYELILPPALPPQRPNWVTIANLPRLTRALDSIFRGYGVARRLPLYLTEYGYQTRPEDPLGGVTHARQAAYLNQSEYIAWRNPRVRTLSQFLLIDDDIAIPASFQSGLVTRAGKRKRSYSAYRLPIWLPRSSARRGTTVRVWGLLRPAPNGQAATADLQFRARGSRRWRTIRRVTTSSPRNYLQTGARITRTGHLRLQYQPPGMSRATSRAAFVRVR
jgi:hypothetical protein